MTIALVLFAISAVVFLATVVANKLVDRWIYLPKLLKKHVGRVLAVCSVSDYNRARESYSFVTAPNGMKLVVVPETLIFADENGFFTRDDPAVSRFQFSGKFRGRCKDAAPLTITLPHTEEAADLFVPYTSDRIMSFAEQERTFIRSADPESFFKGKCLENLKADRRKRWGNSETRYRIGTVRGWSALAVVLSFITCGWMGTERMSAKSDAQPITVHITLPNGAMREVHSTVGEHRKLLMYDGYGSSLILKSRVSELQSGGGGLMRVRVKQSNGRIDCAFADSSLGLRVGDTVYMRFATWLRWASREDRADARFEGEYSVITEAEATALVGTGKFQIIE